MELFDSILNKLLKDNRFFTVVYPHLSDRLFNHAREKTIFQSLKKYVDSYSSVPTFDDLRLMIESDPNITEEMTKEANNYINDVESKDINQTTEYLIDQTEKWVSDRTMELAILESAEILEKGKPRGQIHEKVKDALSVSFKNDLGLEYFRDAKKQLEFYQTDEETIPLDLEVLNEATNGGLRRKTLSLLIGKTNIGKTLFLCHMAASLVKNGYNVVYITGEMSENNIFKRIDANILQLEMNELGKNLTKKKYYQRIKETIKQYNRGRLYIKEYTTGTNRNHIDAYLNELKLKKEFIPDVLIIDYLNIFASSRLPSSVSSETFKYFKSVAEEFRAIGLERDISVLSATQLNREFANKNANDMNDTGAGESYGIPQTADFMGAIIQPPEMYELGKYLFKVIKTRFGENLYDVYSLGVDRKHMKLIPLDDGDEEMPIAVKDRLSYADSQRENRMVEKPSDNDAVWVFDDEIG